LAQNARYVAALLTFHTRPIPLDNLGIDRARTMDGKRILVSLLAGKPPYAVKGSTIIGSDDRQDGIERTAVLSGWRLDMEGKRVVVTGTLRAIEHQARLVGQELVLPWVEIRVEEVKPK